MLTHSSGPLYILDEVGLDDTRAERDRLFPINGQSRSREDIVCGTTAAGGVDLASSNGMSSHCLFLEKLPLISYERAPSEGERVGAGGTLRQTD